MQQPFTTTGWPSEPAPSHLLTILLDVKHQLGALQEGQRSALLAIERTRIETHQRHDRTEGRLWHLEQRTAHLEATPSPASPTTASATHLPPRPSATENLLTAMQHLITILKLLLPLALLAALAAGKISNPDVLPLLRQVLGAL
jgi:hypothetical protein